jgi:hypothetical protein
MFLVHGKVIVYTQLTPVKSISFHPETPDEKLFVFYSETSNFLSWPGNQGIVRRRTSVRRTILLAKLDREGARRVRPTAEVTSKPEN